MPVTVSNRATLRKQMLNVALIAALAATSACNKGAPSGQTVATVNGANITQSELNLEIAASGVSPEQRKAATPQILQMIIDRKLLAQAAEKEGIDKQPEVVLTEQRARETVLAQKAIQATAAASRGQPTESEINAYLDKHPGLGSQRRILTVDQVKFRAPTSQAEVDILKPVKTLDQLVQVLASKGKQTERESTELDTAAMPDDAIAKLNATTVSGEPLVVINGQIAIANVVTATREAPSAGAATAELAKQRLVAERLNATVRQRQATLRSEAKIEYAAGFAPPKAPAGGKAPAQ